MAVLVGIDEAGFGPLLGPLIVSSSSFLLPNELLHADLWYLLRKSVGKTKKHLGGRLIISDSKKVYNSSCGLGQLQRTVLACLKAFDREPQSLTELLIFLCPDCLGRLARYPWYKNADSYQITVDRKDITIAAGLLTKDLNAAGIRLVGIKSCCLDVAFYNQMVSAVKNKSRVLFSTTCRLIKSAFDELADDELHVFVDRQGGRVHYRKELQRMFEDLDLRIIRETPTVSSYELSDGTKKMHLQFIVDADELFLPVCLASMVSKYLRELLVDCINRYFAAFCPELKPTAGYWKDGMRFISQLKKLPQVSFDHNQLVRCR